MSRSESEAGIPEQPDLILIGRRRGVPVGRRRPDRYRDIPLVTKGGSCSLQRGDRLKFQASWRCRWRHDALLEIPTAAWILCAPSGGMSTSQFGLVYLAPSWSSVSLWLRPWPPALTWLFTFSPLAWGTSRTIVSLWFTIVAPALILVLVFMVCSPFRFEFPCSPIKTRNEPENCNACQKYFSSGQTGTR